MPPFDLIRNFGCLHSTSKAEDQQNNSLIYKNTVNEIYFLVKYAGTSYNDVLKMTPIEKGYMIGFVQEEMQRNADKIKEVTESQNKNGR